MVRGSPVHGNGTGSGTPSPISSSSPVDQQILGELKSIRSLLEKR
jgi:hypothetical protein